MTGSWAAECRWHPRESLRFYPRKNPSEFVSLVHLGCFEMLAFRIPVYAFLQTAKAQLESASPKERLDGEKCYSYTMVAGTFLLSIAKCHVNCKKISRIVQQRADCLEFQHEEEKRYDHSGCTSRIRA